MASRNHDTVHDLAYLGNIGILKFKISQDETNANKRDGNERMLIHWAALGGHPEIVEYLLDLGSPVDPLDDNGATPLLLASSAGKVSVVRLLLSRGANPSCSNSGKHSALQYASSKGWQEVVDLLLDQGADANAQDERGATPLHRAASKGIISVMESLVVKGDARINVADSYGNTPLHLACEEDRGEAALFLVSHGALIDAVNKEKLTPLQLASHPLARRLKEAIESRQPLFSSG
ncbi:26S proteasome non-ATPase regulatory subunit 10-like [Ischnura elegans]|uniref:26S proteasome non-ATPase regulatory subunit 10-like n=1 Tax=Ischnura elegans TaxID=197161 RepID=UPI001ED88086|nr:26S proteasome non-ATPase regulatory subunit 10-like [Ischnura elegans]